MQNPLLQSEEERRTTTISFKQRDIQMPVTSPKLYTRNKICTSKYTLLTFIPKNMYQQFKKIANMYFLIVSVLQAIPQISVSEGIPNLLLPLFIVVVISAIKDLLEDLKRKQSDKDENNCSTLKRMLRDWRKTPWSEIRVGDIVKIQQDEYFPADLILISSSDTNGICYIETKNIDGETNLKHKLAVKETQIFFEFEARLDEAVCSIKCQEPNPLIYCFNGVLTMGKKSIPLDLSQLLLRGSSLKNTDWIVGFVVYTGHETKIMLNSPKSNQKTSKLESQMNKEIIYIFVLQVVLCIFAALYYALWYSASKNRTEVYLELKQDSDSPYVEFIIQFFVWMLLLASFVPISLLVALEMVRYIQAMMISSDLKLYYEPYDMPAGVQSSNLNEELGQVGYIFSDKTGTLTCNVMEFRKASIYGRSFGTDQNMDLGKTASVNFVDPDFDPTQPQALEFLIHLACCHTIITQKHSTQIEYNSASPDELALVNAAKYFGVEFTERTNNNIQIQTRTQTLNIKILDILEFTSDRKRMSVIAKMPDGKLKLFCKGADSVIIPRVVDTDIMSKTLKHLEEYAGQGLRTLVLAYKNLKKSEYESWKAQYDEAFLDIKNKEEKVLKVSETIENEMILIGATAIEDKLQKDVPETISFIKSAGIKVWVLTGDKIETAVNIGFSCGLLTEDMIRIPIQSFKTHEIKQEILKGIEAIELRDNKFGLIISGESLTKINKPSILADFLKLASKCEVVLACRVSPQQKAEIVKMIRHHDTQSTTLSIGDGANDVNMICAAHIGVGIAGLEGQQAVRASDYAIAQFSYLKRLMFVHGRECYRKNAVLICFNFYKNVFITIPLFYYGVFSAFSGQELYNMWSYQFFNIFFAANPICVYAVFDKKVELDKLESNSKYYKTGIKGELFNKKVFWLWILEAFLQGLLVLTTSVGFICQTTGDPYTGKMDNMWVASEVVFGLVVIMVNIKVILISYSNYWFSIGIDILCTTSYYFFAWILTEWVPIDVFFDNYDSRGSTYRMLANPNTYSVTVVVLTLGFLFQPLIIKVHKHFIKKKGSDHINVLLEDKKTIKSSLNEFYTPHTGFAFSGEAGHVPQITNPEIFYSDNIK